MHSLVNIWWRLNQRELGESFICCVMFLHPFHWIGSNHLGRVQLFMLSVSEERLLCNCLQASVCHLMKHALQCRPAKSPHKQHHHNKNDLCKLSFVFLIACSSVKQLKWNCTELSSFLERTILGKGFTQAPLWTMCAYVSICCWPLNFGSLSSINLFLSRVFNK